MFSNTTTTKNPTSQSLTQTKLEPVRKRRRLNLEVTRTGSSWGPRETGENQIVRLWLNKLQSSWVDAFFLPAEMTPSQEQFDALWALHPKERGKVKMMGKEILVPRYQQCYGRSYDFSGMHHEALPIPAQIQPWIDLANTQYKELYGFHYNSALINWYEAEHHIGFHSDDERQLAHTKNQELTVYSITFQPTKKPRVFRLKPKTKKNSQTRTDKMDIVAADGLVLVMGGRCQQTHRHCVPKLSQKQQQFSGRRINLTFRSFETLH